MSFSRKMVPSIQLQMGKQGGAVLDVSSLTQSIRHTLSLKFYNKVSQLTRL